MFIDDLHFKILWPIVTPFSVFMMNDFVKLQPTPKCFFGHNLMLIRISVGLPKMVSLGNRNSDIPLRSPHLAPIPPAIVFPLGVVLVFSGHASSVRPKPLFMLTAAIFSTAFC